MAVDSRLLNGIQVFMAVVECGSFARAAETLALTPSAVSRAVARLENQLGVRLLHRTTRSLGLSGEGRAFFDSAGPLLAGLEQAAMQVAGTAEAVCGRLRVNADPFFSRLVLAPRLPQLLAHHPELELDLLTRDSLGDMAAEGMDVAVRFGEPTDSSLVARRLLDTRVLTVAAPAYIERHGRPETPQALLQHTCLHYRDPVTGRPYAWEFRRGRRRIGVPVDGPVLVNDPGVMHTLAEAGMGVAQVLELGSRERLADGRLVELFPDWPGERFPLYAFYPSRRHPPARVRAFIDFCVQLAD